MVAKITHTPELTYTITPHICRACFGRILKRATFGDISVHKCSNCGIEVINNDVRGLCCCGIKYRTGKDSGIRCQMNEQRTPEFPSEIIAAEVLFPPK